MKQLLLNDKFILWIIVFNAITIFTQGFDISAQYLSVINTLDNIFTIVFIVELFTKVKANGIRNYLRSNWNIFDAVLIILAIPSLILWAFQTNSISLDFLLVFRIARVFKFFRFIKFVPNVNQVIKGVNQALKSSIIVILGFFIYNFVVSVISCFLFKNIAPEYFHNPLQSFYTIFIIFTIEGWYEIPNQIAQNTNNIIALLTKVYFIIILLTGGIFGLSLVNSIFVDAMVSDNNENLEKKVDELDMKITKLIKKL